MESSRSQYSFGGILDELIIILSFMWVKKLVAVVLGIFTFVIFVFAMIALFGR